MGLKACDCHSHLGRTVEVSMSTGYGGKIRWCVPLLLPPLITDVVAEDTAVRAPKDTRATGNGATGRKHKTVRHVAVPRRLGYGELRLGMLFWVLSALRRERSTEQQFTD